MMKGAASTPKREVKSDIAIFFAVKERYLNSQQDRGVDANVAITISLHCGTAADRSCDSYPGRVRFREQ
jgi:hypothetical protein